MTERPVRSVGKPAGLLPDVLFSEVQDANRCGRDTVVICGRPAVATGG